MNNDSPLNRKEEVLRAKEESERSDLNAYFSEVGSFPILVVFSSLVTECI